MNDDASGNSDVWYKPFDGSTMQPARLISTERGLLRPGDALTGVAVAGAVWAPTVMNWSGVSLLILNKHSMTVKMKCCLLRYANFFPTFSLALPREVHYADTLSAPNGYLCSLKMLFDPLHRSLPPQGR